MSHTPGPWAVSHGGMPNDEGFSIRSKNMDQSGLSYGIVAECWPCTTDAAHRERLLADARLIAAAPDLLAALKAAIGCIYDPNSPLGLQVAAAIAKAEQP